MFLNESSFSKAVSDTYFFTFGYSFCGIKAILIANKYIPYGTQMYAQTSTSACDLDKFFVENLFDSR